MAISRDVLGSIAAVCASAVLVLVAVFTVPWHRLRRRGVRR